MDLLGEPNSGKWSKLQFMDPDNTFARPTMNVLEQIARENPFSYSVHEIQMIFNISNLA